MTAAQAYFQLSELDRTTMPAFRDGILRTEETGATTAPRQYPGYPRWPLQACRPRPWVALERTLQRRRCRQALGMTPPSRRILSRMLQFGHGVTADHDRGPVPSAGGLQAIELYLVMFDSSWLPAGQYHYDRSAHALAQIAPGADRATWSDRVPSMGLVKGGAFLWIVVGDGRRCAAKYGDRAYRFLLLEAGHLMQNLCLISTSLGWVTVPMGGYFEGEVARAFQLLPTDVVLYLGLAGALVD